MRESGTTVWCQTAVEPLTRLATSWSQGAIIFSNVSLHSPSDQRCERTREIDARGRLILRTHNAARSPSERAMLFLVCASAVAFQMPPRLPATRGSCHAMARYRSAITMQAEPNMLELARTPERVLLLVQDLASRGATKAQVEKAFNSAMEQIYAVQSDVLMDNASVPGSETTRDPNQTVLPPKAAELVAPANPSDAQKAFRTSFSGTLITSVTKKFIDIILEDRATVFRFQYSRVYALGLCALCDAFLPASCRTPEDEAATRSAIFFALGLDEVQTTADAVALNELASSGISKAELFATDDFTQIIGAKFKYTCTLVLVHSARTPNCIGLEPGRRIIVCPSCIFKPLSSVCVCCVRVCLCVLPLVSTDAFGVGLCILMRAVGEKELVAPGRGYGAKFADASDKGAIDEWCAALNLKLSANRLTADYTRPLSIDGAGRFSFESESGLEQASLVSVGVEGSF